MTIHSAACHGRVLFKCAVAAAIAVLCLLPSTAAPVRAEPAGADKAAGGTLAKPSPTPADGLLAKRQAAVERRQRLQQVWDELAARQPPVSPPQGLKTQLELLKYLELVYAQQQVAAESAKELEAKQAGGNDELQTLRTVGPSEKPPYSFLLLDSLHEELAGEQARRGGAEAELDVAKRFLDSVRRTHEEAERQRRAAREAYEAAKGTQTGEALQARLEAAELYSQVIEEVQRLKAVEIENHKKTLAIHDLRVTCLTEKLAAVAKQVKFSAADLAASLAELKQQEEEIRRDLDQAQTNLQQAEQEWWATKQKLDGSTGDHQALQDPLETWRLAQEVYKKELSLLNERLQDGVLRESVWNDRYRIINRIASQADLPKWRQHFQEIIERFDSSRAAFHLRLEEARLDLAALEKRSRRAREANTAAAPWIERQVQYVQRLNQVLGEQLTRIDATQRLVKKTLAELDEQLSPRSGQDWLAGTLRLLRTSWQYEIASIDDQPITVGKVVAGLVLLLIGYILSRRASGLLGTRVLPRFGMNEGVASALQTIAFYLFLATFGFFTLELLHIPVTVFTFLGGAIAIGVGFGSQNVLNNFISGLILLAERPIRVGDVVEIDGLQGNVEQIGARSTRVKTASNVEIIVPNSKFLENNVTNWTLSDTRVRTSVCVGVAYGSPTREVARLLKQAVDANPHVLRHPEPMVLFQGFGDNTLDFEVYFWICVRTTGRLNMESDIRFAIDDVLRAANITIAFPQRDIHLDTTRPLEIRVHGADPAFTGVPPRVQRAA